MGEGALSLLPLCRARKRGEGRAAGGEGLVNGGLSAREGRAHRPSGVSVMGASVGQSVVTAGQNKYSAYLNVFEGSLPLCHFAAPHARKGGRSVGNINRGGA